MTAIAGRANFGRKERLLSRGLTLFIAAVAMYIICGIWYSLFKNFRFDSAFDVLFLFIFPIPCTLVALYFLYTTVVSWKKISYKGVRKQSGCLSIILVFLLFTIISRLTDIYSGSIESIWKTMLVEIPLVIAGGLFYLLIKRFLLKWLSVDEVIDFDKHSKATKQYFFILALTVWSAISNLSELLPRDPDHESLAANHELELLIRFGSIPIAYACYRMGLKLFLKKPPGSNCIDEKTQAMSGGSCPR